MSSIVQKFRSLPYPVKILILAGIYYALGRLGLSFSVVHYSVSLVWPASGVALAAILLFGYEMWPGIALGAFLVNLSNDVALPVAAVIGIGNTFESLLAAYILLRFTPFQKTLARAGDVILLVTIGAFLSAALSATIGVTTLGISGKLAWMRYGQIWMEWWAGDAVGVLIVAPVLLTWAVRPIPRWSFRQTTEVISLAFALVMVSILVFATPLATSGFYPLAYLTFPFLVWAAFRFGKRAVATGNLIIWIIAVWGTTQRIGPFIRSNVHESLIFAFSYVGTMAVTGLLLAAAISERKRSEVSLKENETLLQTVLENLPFEVWVRDVEGRLIMQNPVSVKLWGDLIGKGLEGLGLDEETLPVWQDHNRRTLEGTVLRGEAEVMIHGEQHYFYSISAPFRDGDTIRGILGTNIDITDQKQAAAALRKSEERFSQAFRANPAALSISTLDEGILVDVNPGFLALCGYERQEVIGHTPESLNMVAQEFSRQQLNEILRLHGKTRPGEADIRTKSGAIRRVQYSAEIMELEGKAHVLGIFNDITERKQAEEALRNSEARFRAIFEGASMGIIVVNNEGYCLSVNPTITTMLGYSEEELKHLRFRDFTHPDDVDKNMDLFYQMQKGEIHQYEMEKRYLHKNGSIVWVKLNVSALRDAATGKTISVSLIDDITERKQAEEALRDSEARFRAIFEGVSIGVAVMDSGGLPLSANPALQTMLGYSEEELRGTRFRHITHSDDVHLTVDLFQELQRGEIDHYQIDKRYIHKNGSIVWAQVSVSAFNRTNGQGAMAVSLVEDITERKLAEEALRNSEARFRAIFEGAGIGIAVVDNAGHVVSSNPAFLQMVRYSPEELRQMLFRDFTHPDDVDDNLTLFQQLIDGEIEHYQYEKRYVRKDGGTVWVRINVSSFPDSEERLAVALVEDITQGKVAEAALRESQAHNAALLDAIPDLIFILNKEGIFLDYRAPDSSSLFVPPEVFLGKAVYDVLPESITRPLRGLIEHAIQTTEMQFYEYDIPSNDQLKTYESRILAFGDDKILVMSRDITERKRVEIAIQNLNADLEQRVSERTAELAAANDRLTELDRLKSKFIADVSHELRTPLAVLNTRVYLLENGLPEKRAEYLIGLRDQIERLTQFVNATLDLSRLELGKGKIAFAPVNLNEVVEQVAGALSPRAEANGLRLNVYPAEHLPTVEGEFNQLAQVATNLIANAINYTPNGHIDVNTSLENGHVHLQVKDTGMGIAPDDIPHLFERFYRGERAGQSRIAGSGLGLSIVKEIVDLHDGDITVESEIGQGTTFTVRLPVRNNQ